MIKKLCWGTFVFIFCVAPFSLKAATFSPTTVADLQTALTTAASNAEDDTINLSGTYNVTTGLTFSSVENNALTITGAGADSTILDGGGTQAVLAMVSSGTGLVTISGLTFQNGLGSGGLNGALDLNANGGANIQNNIFTNNQTSGTQGGAFVVFSASGSIVLSNNSVTHNSVTGVGAGAGGGVIVTSLAGTSLTLESNTVTNNTSSGDYGGLYVSAAGPVIFNGNNISSNTASGTVGGAVIGISTNESLTANSNIISGNTASGGGYGGILFQTLGALNFDGNTVSDNTAAGTIGGFYFLGSGAETATVQNNTINHNSVNAGAAGDGGGFVIINTNGNVIFQNNTVTNNAASHQVGGGEIVSNHSITITSNNFSGNTAVSDYAGLIVPVGTDLVFNQNVLLSNSSNGSVGGAYLVSSSGDVEVINNLIASNSASTNFGGLYVIDTSTGSASTFSILNNTISNNSTSSGVNAGAYVLASDSSITTNVYNNILMGNTNDGTVGSGEDVFVANAVAMLNLFNNDMGEVCFVGPGPALSCDSTVLGAQAALNLSNVDPVFIDVAGGNFRLQATSTLIDVGDVSAPGLPTTDIIENPRSFLTIPDIGAYEAVPEIVSSPTAVDFGSVSTNNFSSVELTLSNNGTYDLNVSALTLSDTSNFALDTSVGANPCGSSSFQILSGESCTIGVGFSPDTEGVITGTLSIISDAPATSTYTVNLTGVGTGGGGCSLNSGANPVNLWIYASFVTCLLIFRMRSQRKS